jgi:hypothetical protein
MMIVCYGLGSFMVCVDLARVPVIKQDYAREHPEWRVQNLEFARQTWVFCLGDGEVTALENILVWLPLFFGFMRTVDFLRADYDDEKENRWNDFCVLSGL